MWTGRGESCLSLDSYIKPQQNRFRFLTFNVVYLLIPTSNHNLTVTLLFLRIVVYLLIPTSNHNFTITSPTEISCLSLDSYIKPQPAQGLSGWRSCCLSLDSYIKPQLSHRIRLTCSVVYLLIPTSNHNFKAAMAFHRSVVYLLIPTSNHNC